MTRGTRLLVMMLVLMGVVMLMMQCAKKTMSRKHTAPAGDSAPAGPAGE